MGYRAVAGGLAALVVLVVLGVGQPPAARAQFAGQYMASDSYYRLDVDAGSLAVRVEAQVQSDGGELTDVLFWAMPAAENLVVEQGGETLETEVLEAGGGAEGAPMVISATLANPVRNAQRTDLVMTYDVGPHTSETVSMEAGAMELLFVGQGPGSFVLLDMPAGADNYVDPGCVPVANQPADVTSAGFERYVCGEATMVAISLDDPRVVDQCASLDDRCRQRLLPGPYNGYVQSITDPSKQGFLQEEVELSNGPVTLRLNYFRKNEAWAHEQFEVAKQALPLLESTFGFPYTFESLTMRQSNQIVIAGAAGIAFPTEGEVLLATDTGFDEEVTIHELAHQWAGFNLERKWMWEGLAEYATARVAPNVGVSTIDRTWESFPYDEHLSSWAYTSPITNPDYWYGRSGAFWDAYEAAVGGPEAVTAILAMADDNPGVLPLSEQWFMDQGERYSGANLDQLFLDWVWNPLTAEPVVEARRAAWDALVPLRERATGLGIEGLPSDIEATLDAWQFSGIERLRDRASTVLDDYEAAQQLAADSGLPAVNVLAESWSASSIAGSSERIIAQRTAIATITDAAVELEAQQADSAAWAKLEDAREAYAAGDLADAAELASDAVVGVLTQETAERMIDGARAERDAFSPGLFTRIGLLFTDPDADLAAAEAAMSAGDPEAALERSRAAHEAWDGAHGRGLQRLAMLTAAMAALSVGTWWLLGRLASRDEPPAPESGHSLDNDRSSWRDWGNS